MLKIKYENIYLNHSKDWDYYEERIFGLHGEQFPWSDSNSSRVFIEDYFKIGDKTKLFEEIPENASRSLHSVSAFFLGIIVKDILELPVLKVDFRYLWFLACLYHDFGYCVENETDKHNPQTLTLEKLKEYLKIEHDIFHGSGFRKKGPSLKTVRNYYTYCSKHMNFVNHGIVGGLLFYDRMMKNFYEKLDAARRYNPTTVETYFIHNNLAWSANHHKDYRLIANAILDHNIWYAYKETDKETYRKWKLEDLIVNGKPKLTFESNPFLFLLVLVDTIEPIKAFHQINHLCVLGEIDIGADNYEKKIVISIQDDCINYEPWFANIKEMEKWMQIEVTWKKEIYPRKVSIQIPSNHKT